jgi:uncharacterized protein YbaA (DUF1428 family)
MIGEVTTMKGYVDLYLLPVPKRNIPAYRRQARAFGRIIREYGALDYREFLGDDLFPRGMVSFTKKVKLLPGEVLTAAIAGFRSRSHRDQVLKKMFNDPRMAAMMNKKPLFDMKKMMYGGFTTFVQG